MKTLRITNFSDSNSDITSETMTERHTFSFISWLWSSMENFLSFICKLFFSNFGKLFQTLNFKFYWMNINENSIRKNKLISFHLEENLKLSPFSLPTYLPYKLTLFSFILMKFLYFVMKFSFKLIIKFQWKTQLCHTHKIFKVKNSTVKKYIFLLLFSPVTISIFSFQLFPTFPIFIVATFISQQLNIDQTLIWSP